MLTLCPKATWFYYGDAVLSDQLVLAAAGAMANGCHRPNEGMTVLCDQPILDKLPLLFEYFDSKIHECDKLPYVARLDR